MKPHISADRTATIETPDGATIEFDLPASSERMVAFFIDLAIAHGIWLLVILGSALSGSNSVFAAGLVMAFLIRNFYFTAMELAFSGRTVGKMLLGLRVVCRDGGPLTSQAVLARNLTRDLEWFLPILILLNPAAIIPAGPMWGRMIGVLWFLVFMLLPLFNRQRLRVGDLIGGTLVIKHGRRKLHDDLTSGHLAVNQKVPQHRFSADHLGHYGVLELQTLETVLRQDTGSAHQDVLRRICEKVTHKIGWEFPVPDPESFLRDFYRAQRAQLEQRMLFGHRKESKSS